jgi:hypothetical protein
VVPVWRRLRDYRVSAVGDAPKADGANGPYEVREALDNYRLL